MSPSLPPCLCLSLTDADLHVQLRRLWQPQCGAQGEEDHRSHVCVFSGRNLFFFPPSLPVFVRVMRKSSPQNQTCVIMCLWLCQFVQSREWAVTVQSNTTSLGNSRPYWLSICSSSNHMAHGRLSNKLLFKNLESQRLVAEMKKCLLYSYSYAVNRSF